MKSFKIKLLLLGTIALLAAGCGGKTEYSVGGTITGLTSGLTASNTVQLLLNDADPITPTANGSFSFGNQLEAGSTYDVTIQAQPAGENCTLSNAIGVVESNIGNVTSIEVNCQVALTASNDVQGTVTGLKSGSTLSLLNNGVDPLTVNGTGNTISFAFPSPLALNATYDVVITTPTTQTCAIQNNTGAGQMTSLGQVPTVLASSKTVALVSILCQ